MILSARRSVFFLFVASCCLLIPILASGSGDEDKPNVVVMMTDEHNLRTIGKYREILKHIRTTSTSSSSNSPSSSSSSSSHNQYTHPWGEGVEVLTEHIDSLAEDGAIFSNFYTVSPVCTPSRASFMTGAYPSTNGATRNMGSINSDAVTFAQELKDHGYHTSYMGKWHLDGKSKGTRKFGAPEGRSFGFDDTTCRWNRGHYKWIKKKHGQMRGINWEHGKTTKHDEKNYVTDFLTTRAISYIKEKKQNNETFAIFLSYPDPHSPDAVRAPYDTMYDHFNFSLPETGMAALTKTPALPKWAWLDKDFFGGIRLPSETLHQSIEEVVSSNRFQRKLRAYFGMVKLIDDNIGRILKTLRKNGLEENTIVIFTSDHGDMMLEHGKNDKTLPYKTSAGIPMIVRWPKKIKPGKVVQTAYSSVDFAPTLLSMVGIEQPKHMKVQGIDASGDLLDDEMFHSSPSQIRFIDGPSKRYAAAVSEEYKLIINRSGEPWLIDLANDPDEYYNVYKKNENFEEISMHMQEALSVAMKEYDFGVKKQDVPILLDRPECRETRDALGEILPFHTCETMYQSNNTEAYCNLVEVREVCGVSCKSCLKDSSGMMSKRNKTIFCHKQVQRNPEKYCALKNVDKFCAKTCSEFFESRDNERII